jgi:hypothetical protein
VTEFEIITDINDEYPSKQLWEIKVIECGIIIDVNDEHPSKQL